MKIITPQVNQTGEVRLLSKLLNQKVDTVRCMCSRGKTLTVQGLWVCKKTGSLVEMHLQALELLTFRYAYKTVLNQSKQKKRKKKKGPKQCGVDGRSHPHFYSLIYNSCQVTSANPHPAAWPPPPHGEGETVSEEEQKEEKEPLGPMHIFPLTFKWSLSSRRLFLTGFWHHWRICSELLSVELTIGVKHRTMMSVSLSRRCMRRYHLKSTEQEVDLGLR